MSTGEFIFVTPSGFVASCFSARVTQPCGFTSHLKFRQQRTFCMTHRLTKGLSMRRVCVLKIDASTRIRTIVGSIKIGIQ